MTVEEIENEIRTGLTGQMEEICLFIFSILLKRPFDQNERLSFNTFSEWTNLKPSSDILQSALTALCKIPHHPIEPYFVFLDVREDREVELTVDYVKSALRDGIFINPETGYPVDNFKSYILPLFRVTKDFKEVMSGTR